MNLFKIEKISIKKKVEKAQDKDEMIISNKIEKANILSYPIETLLEIVEMNFEDD